MRRDGGCKEGKACEGEREMKPKEERGDGGFTMGKGGVKRERGNGIGTSRPNRERESSKLNGGGSLVLYYNCTSRFAITERESNVGIDGAEELPFCINVEADLINFLR